MKGNKTPPVFAICDSVDRILLLPLLFSPFPSAASLSFLLLLVLLLIFFLMCALDTGSCKVQVDTGSGAHDICGRAKPAFLPLKGGKADGGLG